MSSTEKKIKNIAIYLTPSLLGSVIPLITFPIMTRFLIPKDFGIIALSASFPGLIVNLLSCNVNSAAQRYYFEYRKNAMDICSLINTTLVFLLCVFMIAAPIVFLIKNFLSAIVLGSSEYGLAIFLSYLAACFNVLINFYLLLYRNMEESKKFSFFTITQMLINTTLGLLLVVGFRLGYMGLIYATFGATLTVFSVLFWRFQKNFPFSFNIKMLIDNLKYGIPLLPNNFIGSIYAFFDKYMLRSISSLSSTGIYSVAQNISNKLFVFMTAVRSTFYPLFMKDMFDRGKAAAKAVGRNFTVFTYISLSAVLGMILFGEEIIYILAPSSYYKSINVMIVILCGIAIQTFGKIVGIQLAYVKKAYLSFPISVAGLITNVLLNILLIPVWGAMGAGLATVMTIFIMNIITIAVAQGYYKIIYEKKVLIFLYLNVFLSAIVLIYFRSLEVSFLLRYSLKLVSVLAFIFSGIYAKIITKRTVKTALNIVTFGKAATSVTEAVSQ